MKRMHSMILSIAELAAALSTMARAEEPDTVNLENAPDSYSPIRTRQSKYDWAWLARPTLHN